MENCFKKEQKNNDENQIILNTEGKSDFDIISEIYHIAIVLHSSENIM